MLLSKEKFLAEVKSIMYSVMGSHFNTDIDKKLEDEDLDRDGYIKARRKGKILRIEDELIYWINGIRLTWELLNYPDTTPEDADLIEHGDIIPDFKQVYDRSRYIGSNDEMDVFSEYCRLR